MERFEILVTREFLKTKANKTLKQFAATVGLELFCTLLFHSGLQGEHIVFPRKSTLQRLIVKTKVRNELRHLKPRSKSFKFKLAMLSKQYGLKPERILKIFEGTK